jgi:integrase
MATVNFLYRSTKDKAPLTLRLLFRHKGKDFVFSSRTKYEVEKNYWSKKHFNNSKNAEIKVKQAKVTSDLLKIENYVLDKFKTINDIEIINKEWLKNLIYLFYYPINPNQQSELVTDAIENIIKTAHIRDNGKGGVGIGKCRVNSYKRLLELFNEFQKGYNYTVPQLDKSVFEAFKKWLLDDKKFSPTYSFKKLSDLKTVCKDARSNGIETSPELNDIKTRQVSAYDDDMDVITLTLSDIKKIEKVKLINDAHINARKWLILACYTGQRGQALTTRIKNENFEKRGSNLVIKIRQKKGNKSVIIPVLPKVKEIYERGMPYTISMQKLNKHFKEIGKIAGIDNLVMGRIIETKVTGEKRGIKKLRPKYKYMSTHIGRRTFASLHYGKIPTPVIMRVTGHSKESTFLHLYEHHL